MQVRVDRDSCLSSGMCAALVPAVFGQDDEGTVLLRVPRPAAARHPAVRRAAAHCPGAAIRLREEAS